MLELCKEKERKRARKQGEMGIDYLDKLEFGERDIIMMIP
jgi:hypothetical protein